NRYIIKKELREIITFNRINIINYQEMTQYTDIDIIFCRNLLLYFDDNSRRIAAEGLFDILRPGGFICLGHSESMSRITPLFMPRKFAEAIVYQKPF
ncbi:MAG: protein-glutamate O-methyltransferase CheR, partial [Candidatus Electrothrix sp. ATG2]|nr:protein-glutamate O-methyltransferase CheR [Candidatus Electrothrix sp. ATG2]